MQTTNTVRFDNDLVRWGLHLLDGGGSFFPPANGEDTTNQNYSRANESSTTSYKYSYANEGLERNSMARSPRQSVTSDELIAHVLQEELSSLAAAEQAAESSAGPVDDTSKSAVLSQDWTASWDSDSAGCSAGATGRETEDQGYSRAGVYQDSGFSNHFQSLRVEDESSMGPQTRASGSSPDRHEKARSPDYELYQHGDDDEYNLNLALALSEDEQRFDEEVAKRLTKLESIRHVPRVNTDFPTLDAASLDHQRLIERLVLYGLNERKIQGDGNCQFRALSDQLYRTPDHHKFVRKTIVNQLKACPNAYSGYVPMSYHDYLKKMAKSGEWGDHVTLQAAADHYGVKICLLTSFKDTTFIEISPAQLLSNRVIYLSFWAEIHYNSIYPEGDNPESVEDDCYTLPKPKYWHRLEGGAKTLPLKDYILEKVRRKQPLKVEKPNQIRRVKKRKKLKRKRSIKRLKKSTKPYKRKKHKARSSNKNKRRRR